MPKRGEALPEDRTLLLQKKVKELISLFFGTKEASRLCAVLPNTIESLGQAYTVLNNAAQEMRQIIAYENDDQKRLANLTIVFNRLMEALQKIFYSEETERQELLSKEELETRLQANPEALTIIIYHAMANVLNNILKDFGIDLEVTAEHITNAYRDVADLQAACLSTPPEDSDLLKGVNDSSATDVLVRARALGYALNKKAEAEAEAAQDDMGNDDASHANYAATTSALAKILNNARPLFKSQTQISPSILGALLMADLLTQPARQKIIIKIQHDFASKPDSRDMLKSDMLKSAIKIIQAMSLSNNNQSCTATVLQSCCAAGQNQTMPGTPSWGLAY